MIPPCSEPRASVLTHALHRLYGYSGRRSWCCQCRERLGEDFQEKSTATEDFPEEDMSRTNSIHLLSALRTQAVMLKVVVTGILLAGYARRAPCMPIASVPSATSGRSTRQVDITWSSRRMSCGTYLAGELGHAGHC